MTDYPASNTTIPYLSRSPIIIIRRGTSEQCGTDERHQTCWIFERIIPDNLSAKTKPRPRQTTPPKQWIVAVHSFISSTKNTSSTATATRAETNLDILNRHVEPGVDLWRRVVIFRSESCRVWLQYITRISPPVGMHVRMSADAINSSPRCMQSTEPTLSLDSWRGCL